MKGFENMRCDSQFFYEQERKDILPFPTDCGSHLDRGQREYGRSVDRRIKAVGGKTSTAFPFAPTRTLPLKLRVLFDFIPSAADVTVPPQQTISVKSLRGVPANYRMTTGRGRSVFNRHSLGDWERALLTDTKALGKESVTLTPEKGRGVAVSKDRQRAEKALAHKIDW